MEICSLFMEGWRLSWECNVIKWWSVFTGGTWLGFRGPLLGTLQVARVGSGSYPDDMATPWTARSRDRGQDTGRAWAWMLRGTVARLPHQTSKPTGHLPNPITDLRWLHHLHPCLPSKEAASLVLLGLSLSNVGLSYNGIILITSYKTANKKIIILRRI